VLKEPTGLMLLALGKPSSNVPFIMPKRVAETAPTSRSPSTSARARSSSRRRVEAGRQDVYAKFAKYKPRAEPPSGLAGGKVVKVDRVEWRAIPMPRPQANALPPARST
jgi:peptide/nickel transport system substrate-binding protein